MATTAKDLPLGSLLLSAGGTLLDSTSRLSNGRLTSRAGRYQYKLANDQAAVNIEVGEHNADLLRRQNELNAQIALRSADRVREKLGITQTQLAKQQKINRAQITAEQAEMGGGKSAEAIYMDQSIEDAIAQDQLADSAYDQIRQIETQTAGDTLTSEINSSNARLSAYQTATSARLAGSRARFEGAATQSKSYWDAGTSILTGAGKLWGAADKVGLDDALKSIWRKVNK